MKNLTKIKFLVLTVISVSFFNSCTTSPAKPSDVAAPGTAVVTPVVPPVASNTTITGLVGTNPNLSILTEALTRVNLASTLQVTGPFTFFAPTNTAFTNFLNARGYSSMNAVPLPLLREILLNHITIGSIMSSEFVNNTYIRSSARGDASTAANLSLFVRIGTRVSVNNASFIQTGNGTTFNIVASNGIIHTVDSILELQNQTIYAMLSINPNFSTFVTALNRSTNVSPFVGGLSGYTNINASPFTVFAPTNSAFAEVLASFGIPDIASVNPQTLDNVLRYHIILQNNLLLSSFPVAPAPQNTYFGLPFSIGTAGGPKIKDNVNRVANIIATNIQCNNGVIHVLDKVLLPN